MSLKAALLTMLHRPANESSVFDICVSLGILITAFVFVVANSDSYLGLFFLSVTLTVLSIATWLREFTNRRAVQRRALRLIKRYIKMTARLVKDGDIHGGLIPTADMHVTIHAFLFRKNAGGLEDLQAFRELLHEIECYVDCADVDDMVDLLLRLHVKHIDAHECPQDVEAKAEKYEP